MSDLQVRNINEEVSLKRPGFFKRLCWLFLSPGKLMSELAEKPRILFWMIFGALAIDIPFIVRLPLFKDMLRESSLASSEYMESLGVVMTSEMIEESLPSAMITQLVVGPIVLIISFLLMALVIFAILKLMGGQGKFKAYLSVVVHANIITVLYYLLLIPISYLTNDLHQTIPLTSLATLVTPDNVNDYLLALLINLDVFTIWRYAVMGIGFAAVSKLKKNKVYIATAVVFVIALAIGTFSVAASLKMIS